MVKIITILSILATFMWIAGLYFTVNDQFFKNTPPPEPKSSTVSTSNKQTNDVSIVALGDSLTRGTGDSTGKGYVQYMLDNLKAKTKQKVDLSNLAIKGYTSEQLLTQLKQTEVQRQIRQSDIIVMTIGGNDLFQGGDSISNYNQIKIDTLEKTYVSNLKEIYSTLRELNPDATIYHVGLYNPFSELPDSEKTSSAVRNWNFASTELAASFKKIVYVPTYDLFEMNVNDYLSSDKFHPNNIGYQQIGDRVSSLITFEKEKKKND
jgi:lysophospholipase L1-like esterase